MKKVLNGDGSREYRIALYKELRKIKAQLEEHHREKDIVQAIKEHGREKVLACIAATIVNAYPGEYEQPQREWAMLVISLWVNKLPHSIESAAFNVHPAILEDSTYKIRKLTLEDDKEG